MFGAVDGGVLEIGLKKGLGRQDSLVLGFREVGRELFAKAQVYLRLPAQQLLLTTAADGLAILELPTTGKRENFTA
jgi:hypothetical protein